MPDPLEVAAPTGWRPGTRRSTAAAVAALADPSTSLKPSLVTDGQTNSTPGRGAAVGAGRRPGRAGRSLAHEEWMSPVSTTGSVPPDAAIAASSGGLVGLVAVPLVGAEDLAGQHAERGRANTRAKTVWLPTRCQAVRPEVSPLGQPGQLLRLGQVAGRVGERRVERRRHRGGHLLAAVLPGLEDGQLGQVAEAKRRKNCVPGVRLGLPGRRARGSASTPGRPGRPAARRARKSPSARTPAGSPGPGVRGVGVVLLLVVLRTGGVGVVGDLVVVEDHDPRVARRARPAGRGRSCRARAASGTPARVSISVAGLRGRARRRAAAPGRSRSSAVAVLVEVVAEVQDQVEVVAGGQAAVGGEEAAREVAARDEGQPQGVGRARPRPGAVWVRPTGEVCAERAEAVVVARVRLQARRRRP